MRKIEPVPKPKVRKQRRRFAHRRDSKYAAWIGTLPCVLSDDFGDSGHVMIGCERGPRVIWPQVHMCNPPIQVCHVKSRGAGGSDVGNVVPMCVVAHTQQHLWGTKTFQAEWGIDLKATAEALYHTYTEQQTWPISR